MGSYFHIFEGFLEETLDSFCIVKKGTTRTHL